MNYEKHLRNYETIRKVRKLLVFTINDISYIRMISYFRMGLELSAFDLFPFGRSAAGR